MFECLYISSMQFSFCQCFKKMKTHDSEQFYTKKARILNPLLNNMDANVDYTYDKSWIVEKDVNWNMHMC